MAKEPFIQSVHKAKFKKLPSNFKPLTADEMQKASVLGKKLFFGNNHLTKSTVFNFDQLKLKDIVSRIQTNSGICKNLQTTGFRKERCLKIMFDMSSFLFFWG